MSQIQLFQKFLKTSHFVQNKCPHSSKSVDIFGNQSVDIFISKKSDCRHSRTFSRSNLSFYIINITTNFLPAISGGGISTSVANTSSSGNHANTSQSNGGNPAPPSEAPVPPSLDSLHMMTSMTRSTTSSEGDRLRYPLIH